MGHRITQARIDAGLTPIELAERLGVTKATLNNWETGQRQLTLDRLMQMSEILGVSIAYLLGVDEQVAWTEPISKVMLYVMHRRPVWTKSYGWALVNATAKELIFTDKFSISFDDISEPIYAVPPAFALGLRGIGDPLDPDQIKNLERVWVEPITPDTELGAELRGWYKLHGRLVQNEYGSRFYLDTYGVKWLAFVGCFNG